MADTFRPLSEVLRSARAAPCVESRAQPDPVGPSASPAVPAARQSEVAQFGDAFEALSDRIALARLAALEAYDRAIGLLLERFARDVLARELALSKIDIDALARDALETFAADEPVAIVVSSVDREHIAQNVPVRVDPTLEAGDLLLDVRDGVIDARLAVRLRRTLAAVLS